jgi:hypothetical protein
MSFYIYVLVGFLSGLLGGMGMGGGTVLIPTLTIFLGVEQHVAQATNLLSFLPMAALSVSEHNKRGLIKYQNLWRIILPALITSILGGAIAVLLPSLALKKLFGVFLIALAVREIIVK